MPHPKRRTHRPASTLPSTIWLPGPADADAAPVAPGVLPGWAIDRIRTEFTGRVDGLPAPLLKISIGDTEPGMDARIPSATYPYAVDGDGTTSSPPVLLAELHPDTLPVRGDNPTAARSEMPGAMENGWAGFFHRAHRLLPAEGLLLLATRQRRDAGRLTDPLGSLIACTRTAAFRYLQHIVIVHGHAVGDRIVPTPPEGAPPGLVHSDLLVLTSIASA
jgi:hypothetical protein